MLANKSDSSFTFLAAGELVEFARFSMLIRERLWDFDGEVVLEILGG